MKTGRSEPAVLFMSSQDAPNGVTINAAGGNFSRAEVYVNEGVKLGVEASFEALAEVADDLLDMAGAHPRVRRAQPTKPPS